MTAYTFSSSERAALVVADTGGSFTIYRTPSASLEARYARELRVPSTALVVYAFNVTNEVQVRDAQTPAGGAFIVSSFYNPAPTDSFFIAGAAPGYVGYYNDISLGRSFAFRLPRPYEVVFVVSEQELYWYNYDRVNNRWSWVKYRSLPQRALDNMGAFDAFDPDGIYNYYAQIIGGVYSQLQYDARTLRTIRDPDQVPTPYISLAASNIGASPTDNLLVVDDPGRFDQIRRYTLAAAPFVNRAIGQDEAVSSHLRTLGYSGHVYEIWRKLNRPSLWLEAQHFGSDYNVAIVGTHSFGVWGMQGGDGVSKATGLVYVAHAILPGQSVVVRYGTITVTFEFVASSPVGTQVLIGSDDSATMSAFLAVFNSASNPLYAGGYITASTTIPGPVALYYPPNYDPGQPGPYWVSSHLTLTLYNLDGSPWMPSYTERMRVFHQVKRSLETFILPINSRIIDYGTGANRTEGVAVSESFSVTPL